MKKTRAVKRKEAKEKRARKREGNTEFRYDRMKCWQTFRVNEEECEAALAWFRNEFQSRNEEWRRLFIRNRMKQCRGKDNEYTMDTIDALLGYQIDKLLPLQATKGVTRVCVKFWKWLILVSNN